MRRRTASLNAGMPWEEFRSADCQRELRRRLPAQLDLRRRLMYHLSASAMLRRWKQKLTGHHAGLLREQLSRLEDDIRDIDFSRDVLEPLDKWEERAPSLPRNSGR